MTEIFNGKSCKANYAEEKKQIVFEFEGIANIEEAKSMYDDLRKNVSVLEIQLFHTMEGAEKWLSEKVTL